MATKKSSPSWEGRCFYLRVSNPSPNSKAIGYTANSLDGADPFIPPARPPRHRIDHDFDAWKSMRKRETWEQAEIRAMKRTIANLHRRVSLIEDMAGRPGPSPVHRERDTASEQAIRNSLAGHLTQRIDSAITGIYRHLDRRDAHIAFQLQHQGTRIGVAEYRITKLAGSMSNLIQQAGGYFADVWRTTGGVE